MAQESWLSSVLTILNLIVAALLKDLASFLPTRDKDWLATAEYLPDAVEALVEVMDAAGGPRHLAVGPPPTPPGSEGAAHSSSNLAMFSLNIRPSSPSHATSSVPTPDMHRDMQSSSRYGIVYMGNYFLLAETPVPQAKPFPRGPPLTSPTAGDRRVRGVGVSQIEHIVGGNAPPFRGFLALLVAINARPEMLTFDDPDPELVVPGFTGYCELYDPTNASASVGGKSSLKLTVGKSGERGRPEGPSESRGGLDILESWNTRGRGPQRLGWFTSNPVKIHGVTARLGARENAVDSRARVGSGPVGPRKSGGSNDRRFDGVPPSGNYAAFFSGSQTGYSSFLETWRYLGFPVDHISHPRVIVFQFGLEFLSQEPRRLVEIPRDLIQKPPRHPLFSSFPSNPSQLLLADAFIHSSEQASVYRGNLEGRRVVVKLYEEHSFDGLLLVPKCLGVFGPSDIAWVALVTEDKGTSLASDGCWVDLSLNDRQVIYKAAAYIHAAGVYHGDFEDRNIVRDKEGRFSIVDFDHATVDHAYEPDICTELSDFRQRLGLKSFQRSEGKFDGAEGLLDSSDTHKWTRSLVKALADHETTVEAVLQGAREPQYSRARLEAALEKP
ncbi:hypothetical protein B0H17DRAFT_1123512 [Mycena rosella]|uniref:Protein kinase domain-containing protein n=1 Tax=Mycena rosella TaxID=1033263 RepID=A0AAD7H2A2_MYCRO|nr:hypothetical protein B0H17DRAFT_1123512 [Mycena rosella]